MDAIQNDWGYNRMNKQDKTSAFGAGSAFTMLSLVLIVTLYEVTNDIVNSIVLAILIVSMSVCVSILVNFMLFGDKYE